MMAVLNDYMQISAQLYKHLATIAPAEERLEYIEKINEMLDKRGELVEQLKSSGFEYNPEERTHQTLFELDKGIRERLDSVMSAIKTDIKDLNNTKKHESQYIDPYKDVRLVEGRYFDNKK